MTTTPNPSVDVKELRALAVNLGNDIYAAASEIERLRSEISSLREVVEEQTQILDRWEPYILRVMSRDELTAELRASGITEEMQNRAWERVKALLDARREAALQSQSQKESSNAKA